MSVNIGQLAATVATTLAPFTPFLINSGKAGGKKLVDILAEKGGDAAWNNAQTIWHKLYHHYGNDPEVISAATIVSAKPEDESRQMMFAEVVGIRLKDNPQLAEELFYMIGGQQTIQQVIAERGSWVEDITQQITNTHGIQTVSAHENSTTRNIKQHIQHS
jgi:hypothetical protein